MAIRARIRGLGEKAANAVLDRAEQVIDRLRPNGATSADEAIAKAAAARNSTDDNKQNAGQNASGEQQFSYAVNGPLSPQLPQAEPDADPKALFWDPYSLVEQLGYKERPSALTYQTLSAMVWKVPVVSAIIQTRINQVSAFMTPQHHRFDTGYRIKLRDIEAKPSKADKKLMTELEQILQTTGYTNDPRSRDSFETFVRKIVRDSLTYDALAFEVVHGRDGRPSQWYAVDASTIRLADTYRLHPTSDVNQTKAVQIYDQVIIAEFNDRELAYGVRNPRTDIRTQGYGTAELEMAVSTITQLLWGVSHNSNYFSQGSVPKGLLNLKGAIPEKQLRAFRRQWYQMVAGAENAWRTPVLNADNVEWVSMDKSNRDMEFSAWMDFLIKVITAIFQMDPIEVNFKYGSQGQKSMFDGANKTKLVESKERGLRPLLRFLGRLIDKHIIWPIDPRYTIEFVGLDPQTPKEIADLNTQRVRSMYMVDEIRAENDLPPLPDGLGKVILDANWLADKRQREQMQLQKEQQAAQIAAQVATAHTMAAGQEPPVGGHEAALHPSSKEPKANSSQKKELKQLSSSVAKSLSASEESVVIDVTL